MTRPPTAPCRLSQRGSGLLRFERRGGSGTARPQRLTPSLPGRSRTVRWGTELGGRGEAGIDAGPPRGPISRAKRTNRDGPMACAREGGSFSGSPSDCVSGGNDTEWLSLLCGRRGGRE